MSTTPTTALGASAATDQVQRMHGGHHGHGPPRLANAPRRWS